MWSDGRDTSESGEHVLLLQPITGKATPKKPSPSSSHTGGLPCFYDSDSWPLQPASTVCTICNEHMHLLLRLNAPLDDLDRTLYVFGCNRPTCHTSASPESGSKFQIGFNGSPIRCFRSQRSQTRTSEPVKAPIKPEVASNNKKLANNDWGDDGRWGASDSDNDDDYWGVVGSSKVTSNDVSMDNLEAMISKCEMQSKQVPSNVQPKSQDKPQALASNNTSVDNATNAPSFRQYNLEMFDEPSAPRKSGLDDDEDDDDDFGDTNNIDSTKVNQMLSKYLAMEDDEEILSALRDGGAVSGDKGSDAGKGGGGGERYERLPPDERAFMAFSKRLKRAPKQVVRYAYGGVPLWSIPCQQPKHNHSEEKKESKSKKKLNNKTNQSNAAKVPAAPPCKCGSQRVFEFQLLPSMLHVLDVDSTPANETYDETDLTSIGGMNWGSIAVYSCPESCDESREEVCLVQSGDEVVKKMEGSAEEDDDNSMDGMTK